MIQSTRQPGWEALTKASVGVLTTFRRDGRGVATPVSILARGGRTYFTTWARTAKVKRLANSPRITVAPSDRRGRVTGAELEGVARRLSDDESKALNSGLRGRLWTLVYRVFLRSEPVSYEIVPSSR